jgi:hypothetical protein
MNVPVIYVVTKNSKGLYKSTDEGATFVQVATNVVTTEVTDIAIADREYTHSVITYGDGIATTPYYSFDDGATYQAGQNTVGKEVTYVGQNTYVFGSINSATGSGAVLEMSLDEGISINSTIDVTPLFNYTGAIYSNITVTGFDFPNSAGGYITVAGNQNDSTADQLLTRTYDRGASFPDALILPGSMGIIRGVWTNPERNVVFAIGNPDSVEGALYSINPSLTEAPIKVLDGITVGNTVDNLTVKFASVPSTYNLDVTGIDPLATFIKVRSKVYFLDSSGNVYYSDDYGFTWQFKSKVPGKCVDIIAISENTVFVLSKSPTSVFKSVDGGNTFIEIPQPSWVDPKAMAFTFVNPCNECNAASEVVIGNQPTECTIIDRSVGTLCKAPYVYSEALGACAKPSTIVPTNLLLSIDYSGSVSPTESSLFRSYIKLLIKKIEDRLLDGSMQVGIIGWSANACIQQPFTNDINALYATVDTDPPGLCNNNLTNHTEEFCLSIRTMYEQSVLRPTAENVLVVFTDDADATTEPQSIRSCDLSDIGILPVVLDEATSGKKNWAISTSPNMYQLIRNAKADLNGVGMKVMMVSLGNLNERRNCQGFFIDAPRVYLGSSYIVPSAVPNTNNLYYFDGGTFDTAEFIADQIRLGLAAEIISSPECPPGCIGRPGIDGLGYCYCNEDYLATQCTIELVNCDTGQVVPVVPSFKSRVGKVIKLAPKTFADVEPFFYDGGTGCWLVRESQTSNPNYFDARANSLEIYTSCPECANPPWYSLTDCLDDTFIVYTRDSLSDILSRGNTIITHSNYPDRCLLIKDIGSGNSFPEVPILGNILTEDTDCTKCPQEPAINFKLTRLNTDCSSDLTNIIYTLGNTSDLQPYINQVVNLENFGSACWLVEIDLEIQTVYQPVVVTTAYPACTNCQPTPVYQFVNTCEGSNVTLYSNQDFSQYVNQIVNLQEYPGNCFSCTIAAGNPTSLQNLTISGDPYPDCPSCLVTYYQLTNCANPEVFLISTSTELSKYVGRTITAAGYTGLCFTVTRPQCNCIRATINGVEYDAYAESTQFNGRNVYYITTDSGDQLAIAWSVNPNQWELFDRNTSAVLGFNTADNDCPFSNFWTIVQGSPYIITTVSFCADRIYNIAPELEFADCEPCINCI